MQSVDLILRTASIRLRIISQLTMHLVMHIIGHVVVVLFAAVLAASVASFSITIAPPSLSSSSSRLLAIPKSKASGIGGLKVELQPALSGLSSPRAANQKKTVVNNNGQPSSSQAKIVAKRTPSSGSSKQQSKIKPYDTTYKSKPPTFNKSLSVWEPSSQTEPSPYGPFGSFLRGGPSPFIIRVLNPTDYDQAVYKYMSSTGCSRLEAQGNMDAYFNNAADWAYQKSEESRGRPVVDYTELRPQQALLVVSWALFVTPLLGRCVYLIAAGGKGWAITIDDIFSF